MNQILFVEKSKKGNSLEINTIVKIFAIAIIIFGIILIAKGTYGIVNSSKNEEKTEPIVSIQEVDGKLQINVIHNKIIDRIVYSWKKGQEVVLQGKGQTSMNETINIPVGTNTLTLKVIDIDKKEVTYTKEYYKADVDTTSPEIELVVEGSKVKIVAKDETELSHISYHWDDEDETIIEVREDSKKQIEEKISILKGEHTLTIVAVDANENESTKEQVFKGAKKPTINLTQENDELVIRVNDEENIQKIEITLNGEFFSTDADNTSEPLNMKEAIIRQKLQPGANTITITAYNVSGLSEQVTKEVTI